MTALEGSGGPGICKCGDYMTCDVCVEQHTYMRGWHSTETPLQEIVRWVSSMTTDELQIVIRFLRGCA